ncbi:unnamed protein product [Pieris macdunnoughi]|uniref:Uncharacterized protein n=1 Tax=Pieris macdunnoughi TaxID=345717 RepID=A0A821UWP5_9NEOP|nr:unnamed protein product [Pieris macdunnoughi]
MLIVSETAFSKRRVFVIGDLCHRLVLALGIADNLKPGFHRERNGPIKDSVSPTSLKRTRSLFPSGQAATNINTWRYAELMEFLLPYMKNRSRSTNLNSTNTQSSATPETSEVQDDEDANSSEVSVFSRNDTINNAEAGAPQEGRLRQENGMQKVISLK